MEHSQFPSRRRHSDELRAMVVRECVQPSTSVAAIALAHGINANLVHKWRRQARGPQESARPEFIALALPAPTPAVPPPVQPDIHMELRRAAVSISIRWPVCAAPQCAAWLGQWLR